MELHKPRPSFFDRQPTRVELDLELDRTLCLLVHRQGNLRFPLTADAMRCQGLRKLGHIERSARVQLDEERSEVGTELDGSRLKEATQPTHRALE